MKKKVSIYDFHDWFAKNETYGGNFSYEGQNALFEYLENYEEETGEELDFDPVAFCVDYAEYDSTMDCAKEYGYEDIVDLEPYGSVDLLEVAELEEKQALEWLQDRTTVIEVSNGHIIIQNF